MRHSLGLFAALVAVLPGCATVGGYGAERAVLKAKDRVAPALVHIRPVKEVFTQGRREEMKVLGSGFIISDDGYVVTNEHVAGESSIVSCVLWNNAEVDAEVVGTDPFTDLAVLKLQGDFGALPTATMAPDDELESGQTVLALGSPHGLSRSVSMGIVSVTDRYLGDTTEMVAPFNNWIQTDAAINPGNSGGPLVNLRGEVVGVNTRKLGNADNVGFAIPIATVREVVNEIIEAGRVRRSWLGLGFQELSSVSDGDGVLIAFVDPMSPSAESALLAIGGKPVPEGQGGSLMPGDVLVSVNGAQVSARYVEDLPAVRKTLADLPIGETAQLGVLRGGEPLTFGVTALEQTELRGDQQEFTEWGFTGGAVTPLLARRAQLPNTMGVLITSKQVGGVADNAGLNQLDLIIAIDGTPVESLESFKTLYGELVAQRKESILLDVKNIQRSTLLTRYVLLKQNAPAEDSAAEPAGDGAEGSVPGVE